MAVPSLASIKPMPTSSTPGQSPAPLSDLLTTDEACRYLRLSRPTLERRRLNGEEPVFIRLGKRIYYQRADLDAWLVLSRSKHPTQS